MNFGQGLTLLVAAPLFAQARVFLERMSPEN